jgi:hypothetical protein
MTTTIEVGGAPCNEECAQVGAEGFSERNRAECRAYINLIRRAFGNEPDGATLIIKSNAHDFGNYREVAVRLDDDASDEAIQYADRCESDAPAEWDDEALAELAEATTPVEKKYWQGSAPGQCDVCTKALAHAFSDARTLFGSWANLCDTCASRQCVTYGTGTGQRYERQEDGRWLKTRG